VASSLQEARIRNIRRSRRPDIFIYLLFVRVQWACRVAAESDALVYFANLAIVGYMVCMSLEHEYSRFPEYLIQPVSLEFRCPILLSNSSRMAD
jgi:hypothetical protein